MWVLVQVGVGDHPCHILTVEVVVGAVDVPRTPVGVVVAVGARTKVAIIPERLSLPMIVVMAGKRKFKFNRSSREKRSYLKQFILISAEQ